MAHIFRDKKKPAPCGAGLLCSKISEDQKLYAACSVNVLPWPKNE